MIHEETVDSDVYITFLNRILIGSEQSAILIVDRHPVHKSAVVKRFAPERNGRLKLLFLSPNLPRLIPDEKVWVHVKRECRASWSLTRSK